MEKPKNIVELRESMSNIVKTYSNVLRRLPVDERLRHLKKDFPLWVSKTYPELYNMLSEDGVAEFHKQTILNVKGKMATVNKMVKKLSDELEEMEKNLRHNKGNKLYVDKMQAISDEITRLEEKYFPQLNFPQFPFPTELYSDGKFFGTKEPMFVNYVTEVNGCTSTIIEDPRRFS